MDKVKTSDSGVYWCQSGSDVLSAVSITVHGGHVILESPALPVTEGHSVSLRCRYRKNNRAKESFSCLTADFYRDGSLISNESTGEMTIPVVNKSDDGLWKCRCGNHGDSPESWMTVTDAIPSTKSPTIPSTTTPTIPSPCPSLPKSCISLSRLLYSLLVVSPYLMVTPILLGKYRESRISTPAATGDAWNEETEKEMEDDVTMVVESRV
ncbi:hypothetical protein UPYG_G00246970 [Umbra pygmaea]|uniref:Ig-like domain-containing protein n=1 Tax=Umbra pygmaea TaxID=75934 RepID=A0ABD0WGH4_UMBPY